MPSVPLDPTPAGVPDLLRRLLTDDPGRPRLTWYGPDGERAEFSAKVLDNWVAKTANLLVEEVDAGPGSRVAIALPAHWRTVTWLLAAWSTGACAVLVPADAAPPDDADAVVAADPELLRAAATAPRAVTVAVALPVLARGYGPGLAEGALDAVVEIRSRGDVFVPLVHPVATDAALETPSGKIGHGELLPRAARAADHAGWPAGVRLLTDAGAERVLDEVVAPLLRLGSVVLHHDLPSLDEPARSALQDQEGITAVAAPGR
ncbi:MAG TPA: TIGR03089 family protein [Kineosporiaceae bacterium]